MECFVFCRNKSYLIFSHPSYADIKNKALITLIKIRSLEYAQSRFEKIFHVGRVTVTALPCFETINGNLENEKYPLKRSYTFYGVKNYSEVKAYFEKSFPSVKVKISEP